jgi:predicted GIY-YIG superfamily endonuclease|tara:strand:- start:626 stop:1234 length:609 start_codon:yes stop_codon:yes gene_type:complete
MGEFNFIGKDDIGIIKKTLPIDKVVSYYTNLTPRGRGLVGQCPLCFKYSLKVSVNKKIMKCFNCGLGGNVINFIKKYENLTFGETLDFIQQKFIKTLANKEYVITNPLRGTVYVLSLMDDCFYIGFTNNLHLRIKQHFSNQGSIWTKMHKPISLIDIFPDKTLNYENYLTDKYILKYGYHKVKGGDHIYFKEKYNSTGKMFE